MKIVVSIAIAIQSGDSPVGQPYPVVGLHPRRNLGQRKEGEGEGQWSGRTVKGLVELTCLLQTTVHCIVSCYSSPCLDHDMSTEARYPYFAPKNSLCEADVGVRVYVEPIPFKYTTVLNLGSK